MFNVVNQFEGSLNQRICDAADFNGTNNYMLLGTDLTGNADSKKGIFYGAIRIDALPANFGVVIANSTTGIGFRVIVTATGIISVRAENIAGVEILRLDSSTHSAGATWLKVLASWDLAIAATHLYISDISDKTVTTATNDTIDYTKSNFAVGGYTNASIGDPFLLNGCLAELYFAPGQYLDLSVEANRRKFISSSGRPQHLGTDGSLPTGTAPLVYLHLDDAEAVANFATNRGTGGDFTITGTLDTASTSPSD